MSTDILPSFPEMRVHHASFGTVSCSIGDVFSVECCEREFHVIVRFFKLMMDSRWRRRTKNVFFRPKPFEELSSSAHAYYVGCLSAGGNLDFDEMEKLVLESKRSESERINAVLCASDVLGLPEPRLWAPLYDRNFTYIVYGPSSLTCSAEFPSDKVVREDVSTYQDYFTKRRGFEVKSECKLFDAQRLWVLPFSKASTDLEEDEAFEPKKPVSDEHSKLYEVCEDFRSLKLPRDACIEVPMANPNFLLLCTHLPQVSYFDSSQPSLLQ